MSKAGAEGIMSGLADLDADTRQVRSIDSDCADFLPGQAVAYPHRHERTETLNVPLDPLPILRAYLDKQGQPLQHPAVVLCLLSNQQHLIVLAVDRNGNSLAVDDLAARRRQKPHRDAVVLRQQAVAFRIENLKLIEPAQ